MPSFPASHPAPRSHLIFVAVLSIGLFFLHVHRLNEPLGGFHAMNEAWYSSTIRNYSWRSLLRPEPMPGLVDFKLRPLYGHLGFLVRPLFPSAPAAGRTVTALFASLALFAVYDLGRRAFDPSTALWGALFFFCAPIAVLCGRLVQPDMAYLCLALMALASWFAYKETGSRSRLGAALVFLALSFLAKNFALFAIVGILSHEILFGARRTTRFGAVGALVGIGLTIFLAACSLKYGWTPSLFRILSVYRYGSTRIPSADDLAYIRSEAFWGLSPFLFALGAAGLAVCLLRLNRKTALFLVLTALAVLLYLVQNVHSYYMLTLAPFVCILAGRTIVEIKERAGRWDAAFGVAAAAFAFFFACLSLGALKYGQGRFEAVGKTVRQAGPDAALFVRSDVLGNYGPLLHYEAWETSIIPLERALRRAEANEDLPDQKKNSFILDFYSGSSRREGPYEKLFFDSVVGWDFLGARFLLYPKNKHSFRPAKILFLGFRPGRHGMFGPAMAARRPSLKMTVVPPGYRMRAGGDGGLILTPTEGGNR